MARFDRTESGRTGRSIEKAIQNPKIAKVVAVFEHGADDDGSNFEVDVNIIGEDTQHRSVPFLAPANNEIRIPRVGDKVIVEYRGGAKKLPVARGAIYTNRDRAPRGRAGMWRKRVESGSSPAGDGSLYVETYTDYSENPAKTDPSEDGVEANEAFVRIAKKEEDDSEPSAMIELLDSPEDDSSEIVVKLQKVDGGDSDETWGLKFDLKSGEFKLLDAGGYGIVSDGKGDFTWHHKDIEFSEDSTTSL